MSVSCINRPKWVNMVIGNFNLHLGHQIKYRTIFVSIIYSIKSLITKCIK